LPAALGGPESDGGIDQQYSRRGKASQFRFTDDFFGTRQYSPRSTGNLECDAKDGGLPWAPNLRLYLNLNSRNVDASDAM